MARKRMTAIQAEQNEILRIFNQRERIPRRTASFIIKSMSKIADAFPTRKDGEFWCDDCGERFSIPERDMKPFPHFDYICPHCGAHIEVYKDGIARQRSYAYNYEEYTVRPRTNRTDHYFKEITTYKGWQVIKEYFVSKRSKIGQKPRYDIDLVYSIWMNPKTKRTHIYSLWTIGLGQWYCRTPFALSGNYHFARSSVQTSSLYSGWVEDVLYTKSLPYFPEHGCDPESNHEILFSAYTEAGTEIETLTKLGYRDAATLIIESERYRKVATKCWRGIVLALRHGYGRVIEKLGWGMYLDYLKELKELRLDWHSPHYLCPEDFHAAHAETSRRMTKKMKERAERMAEGKRRAAMEWNVKERERKERAVTEFEKRIQKFLPLLISGMGIVIQPLKSVSEFADEGDAMHHCVYSNGYYMRPECLILSARTDEGKRLETVEVNLDKYNIVQSRAVCNGVSDQHNDIINLVTAAMPQIKALARGRKVPNKLIA